MSKWAKKRDAIERDICSALREIPWPAGYSMPMPRVTVQPIEGATAHKDSSLPKAGTPDLLVGWATPYHGRFSIPIEVKMPKEPGRGREVSRISRKALLADYTPLVTRLGFDRARMMSPVQLEWAKRWRGPPVACVTTAREAAAALGLCLVCGEDNTNGLCDEHAAEETTT